MMFGVFLFQRLGPFFLKASTPFTKQPRPGHPWTARQEKKLLVSFSPPASTFSVGGWHPPLRKLNSDDALVRLPFSAE